MKIKLVILILSFFFLTPSVFAATVTYTPAPNVTVTVSQDQRTTTITTNSSTTTTSSSSTGRNYDYPEFDVDYIINPDSTVDVVETQTFHFVGTYNQGLRTIPTRIGEWISDVSVFDVTDNHPLTYSPSRLNKTSSASWGNYTTYSSDGYNIEWYYNLSNTTHTFQIHYRFHGAIEFGTMYDRFNWNAFDHFQVPIHQSTVTVKLPSNFDSNQVQQYAYRSGTDEITQSYTSSVATFSSSEFTPYEAFTVDLAWPRGYLDRGAYWQSFLLANYGYLSIPVIFLFAIIACLIFWLTHEYFPSKARPIIPLYEPPSDLPPAVAGILVNESFSNKSFATTIVDLAVRGYLKIEEEKASYLKNVLVPQLIIMAILLPVLIFILLSPISIIASQSNVSPRIILFATIAVVFFIGVITRFTPKKDYRVTKTEKFTKLNKLASFEADFLSALFVEKDYFSTLSMSSDRSQTKLTRYRKIQKVQQQIINLAQDKTNAYIIPPAKAKWKWVIWLVLLSLMAITPFIITNARPEMSGINQIRQGIILVAELILGGLITTTFIKFEARLNQAGNELKDKWLGFKLFLSVAEKERLKNLTPDLFEKYLPYAMVFGVEKKWSRAFDSILTQPPSWYGNPHGGYTFGSSHGGSFSGSFSASSFGASFSSSFSSSIASSGAAGASGGAGGGGAGGGGGGGGGGAS